MAVRDALVALLGALDDLEYDSDLASELAELFYSFRVPDTGDTATVNRETANVLRVPGRADTAVTTVTQETGLKVWRSRTVDGATWYFVSEAAGGTEVVGWMHQDWLTVTTGGRPASSYHVPGLHGDVTLDEGLTVNENGTDSDTRIEGDTDQNLVFVDASTDRVGIGTSSPDVKLQVVGVLRTGEDTTNYANFDSTGHLTMAGTARPWRDELGELIGKKRKGSRITEDLDEGTLLFSDTCQIADDWVITNVQMNHDKDLSADIYPHLHWFQASANVPNWMIQYRWQANGGAKTTAWTSAASTGRVFTYTAGTLNQISLFAAISPPVGTALSDIVQFRILRDTDNDSGLFGTPGTDPLAGSASALMFDVHLMINSLGSTDEYAK